MAPINYAKWDAIEDDEPSVATQSQLQNHQASLAYIGTLLKEACPQLAADDTACLVQWISTQHGGVRPNNLHRAGEIIALERRQRASGRVPSRAALIHLLKWSQQRSEGAAGDGLQARRVVDVAFGALNTLHACEVEGGADALFSEMGSSPDGEVATRYLSLGYAKIALEARPVEKSPPAETGINYYLRRALLVQVALIAIYQLVVLARDISAQ